MANFISLRRHNVINKKNIIDQNRRIQFVFKCYTLFVVHVCVNKSGTGTSRQGMWQK